MSLKLSATNQAGDTRDTFVCVPDHYDGRVKGKSAGLR